MHIFPSPVVRFVVDLWWKGSEKPALSLKHPLQNLKLIALLVTAAWKLLEKQCLLIKCTLCLNQYATLCPLTDPILRH